MTRVCRTPFPERSTAELQALAWRPSESGHRTCQLADELGYRHIADHGTLVAGSQVSGLSTTFSGKRPLLHNFPSGKERKVVSCLEGKLSPTNAKDEKSRRGVEEKSDASSEK